jgi:hypothetical protein
MKNGNKKAKQMRYCSIVLPILLIVVLGGGCSKHISPATSNTKADKIISASSVTIRDSLVGGWKLDKIETPNLAEKMASFGSQAEKDALNKTVDDYRNALKGLTVTFNKDSTFQSSYGGQSDVGTWVVNAKREIVTVSKVTDNTQIYTLLAMTGGSIKVKLPAGENILWLTFLRK